MFVAMRWKNYSNSWKQLDREFKALSIIGTNLKRRNARIFRWFVGLTAVSTINLLLFYARVVLTVVCSEPQLQPDDRLGSRFFHQNFPDFFAVFPYHLSIGIYLVAIDTCLNFAWVFNDSFIIIVSLLIARQIETFHKKISMNLAVMRD